jgi:predicted RNase H-like HicB family nuclease
MEDRIIVNAFWDDVASYWVAESDDVPGLATGGVTLEELVSKLKVMIPELLELNASLRPRDLPISLKAEYTFRQAV